jgi:hypothetical protein
MSDAKAQGGRLQSRYRELQERYDTGETIQTDDKNTIGQFPAQYVTPDPRDDLYKMKATIARGENRRWDVSDEEAAYVLDKQKGLEAHKFDKFFWDAYEPNTKDPAKQRVLREIYPAFWDRRLKKMEEIAKVQLQVARIKMLGPQSEEDLQLLYAIHSGLIEIPESPLHKLDDQTPLKDRQNFSRGMFNPIKHIIADKRGAWTNPGATGIGGAVGPAVPAPPMQNYLRAAGPGYGYQ